MSPKSHSLSLSLSLSQSMKKEKNYSGVFGDMYSSGVAIIPKYLELDKEAHPSSTFELQFQFPDLSQPIKTREVGEFLSGALAGAMTKAVLAPLETIRTRMIVGVGSRNISGSFLEVIEKQGWQGLWAGNAVNMILENTLFIY